MFEDAIQREAAAAQGLYSDAYAALADCYTFLFVTGGKHSDLFHKAMGAAIAATSAPLPTPNAYAALGAVRAIFEWKWDEAEQAFLRALDHDPECLNAHGWYSGLLSCLGRSTDAIEHARRAMALDPLSTFTSVHAGKVYYFCRRYPDAIVLLQSLAEHSPENFLIREMLGMTYAAVGDLQSAANELEQACRLSAGKSVAIASLANVFARLGRRREAEELLSQILVMAKEAGFPKSQIAQVWVGLGDTENAVRLLESAVLEHDFYLSVINGWAPFDPIRQESRFKSVLHEIGLPLDAAADDTSRHVTLR